jgi:hypothetical protein
MTAPNSAKPSAKPKPKLSGWQVGGRGLSEEAETPEEEKARLALKAKQRKAWDRMMRSGGLR